MKMITISFAAIIGLFGIIQVEASPTPTGESSGIKRSIDDPTDQNLFHIGYQDGKFRLVLLGNLYEVENPLNFAFGGKDSKDTIETDGTNPKTKHRHRNKKRRNGGENVSHKHKTETATETSFISSYQKILNLFGLNEIYPFNAVIPNNSLSNLTYTTDNYSPEATINDVENKMVLTDNYLSNNNQSNFDINDDKTNINSYHINANQYNISPDLDKNVIVIDTPNQSSNESNFQLFDNSSSVIEPDIMFEEVFYNRSQKIKGKQKLRSLNPTDDQSDESASEKRVQELSTESEDQQVAYRNSKKRSKGNSKYYLQSKTEENMEDEIKSSHQRNKNKKKEDVDVKHDHNQRKINKKH